MEALTAAQLTTFSEVVCDIHRGRTVAEIADRSMRAAERLIGGEHGYFFEFFRKGGMRLVVERTGPDLSPHLPALVAFHHQHPGIRFCLDDPAGGPSMASDFLDLASWHRQAIYQEFCRPLGIEENAGVDFRPAGGNLFAIVLNRPSRTFTEQHRFLFGLLREHVTASLERVLESTPAASGAMSDEMLLDRDGRVLWFPENCRRQLARFFPDSSARELPGLVASWIQVQLERWHDRERFAQALFEPLLQRNETGICKLTLTSGAVPDSFALRIKMWESAPDTARLRELGLTGRQADVLFWLAQGKSNPEIAIILQVGLETVKSHLKQIYQTLGVETRIAACNFARDFGCLGR